MCQVGQCLSCGLPFFQEMNLFFMESTAHANKHVSLKSQCFIFTWWWWICHSSLAQNSQDALVWNCSILVFFVNSFLFTTPSHFLTFLLQQGASGWHNEHLLLSSSATRRVWWCTQLGATGTKWLNKNTCFFGVYYVLIYFSVAELIFAQFI